MKYILTASAAAILLLAAPAFAQGMSGPNANGSVKTSGGMASGSAMSSGTGMSGNAMASGTVKSKKKKTKTSMSGGMSGNAMSGGSMSGPQGSMSGSATTP